jgi:hypothetical protein
MKKLRVLLPLCGPMSDENISPDTIKPVRKRRGKVVVAADNTVDSGDELFNAKAPNPDLPVYDAGEYEIDLTLVERIRNGEWREVLREVGSTKYNELRLLALK